MVLALVGPGDGARGSVAGGSRVVDVDEDTGLAAIVGTGEVDSGRGRASARSANGKLGAANVELSTALLAGAVETNVLSAHEVVALGQGVGQGEGEVVDARVVDVGGPLEAGVGDGAGGQLVDLEPLAVAEVVGGLGAVGGLAHVDGEGAGVAQLRVDGEADLVTGLDRVGARLGADVGIEATLVADDVVRGDVGDGRVGVGGLAHKLVGLSLVAVDDESLEVVVGKGGRDGGSNGQEGREGTHLDGCCVCGGVCGLVFFLLMSEKYGMIVWNNFYHQGIEKNETTQKVRSAKNGASKGCSKRNR